MSYDAIPEDPTQITPDAVTAPEYIPIDLDANGTPEGEYSLVDSDGDGRIEAIIGYTQDVGAFAILDVDGDGDPDLTQIDTTGDGVVDMLIERTATGYLISIDADQDGVPEQQAELTASELASAAPVLYTLLEEAPAPTPAPTVEETLQIEGGAIVGDPFRYGDEWFYQTFDGACLPASTAVVLEEYLGREVSEAEVISVVNELGGWQVGEDGVPGLFPGTMVELLEHFGIDAHLQENSSMDDLLEALAEGYAVGVAVDSGYIWTPEGEIMPEADHMLLIAGIDVESGIVYLSDSGTMSGNVEQVPIDQFVAAWSGSANTMVVSDLTVEEFAAAGGGIASEDASEDDILADETVAEEISIAEPVSPDGSDVDVLADEVLDTVPAGGEIDPAALTEGIGDIDIADLVPTPLEQVVHTLTRTPWIVIPLVLGGGAALTAALARKNSSS